jgi:hypothetical protein
MGIIGLGPCLIAFALIGFPAVAPAVTSFARVEPEAEKEAALALTSLGFVVLFATLFLR